MRRMRTARRGRSHDPPARAGDLDRDRRLAEPDDDRPLPLPRLRAPSPPPGGRVHARRVRRVPHRRSGHRARPRPASAVARPPSRAAPGLRAGDGRRRPRCWPPRRSCGATARAWPRRTPRRSSPRRKSSAILGATITAVELPTAFPYFAVIAAVVGADVDMAADRLLLVVFNALLHRPAARHPGHADVRRAQRAPPAQPGAAARWRPTGRRCWRPWRCWRDCS